MSKTLYSYGTAEQVASIIKTEKPSDWAVVDVRDNDFIGGQIPRAIHIPSVQLVDKLDGLVERLKDTKTVVFHCMLSQQRGPSAARRYAEAREDALKAGKITSTLPNEPEDVADGKAQEVIVLRRGFQGWVEKYAKDRTLVENYDERIWGI